MAAVEAMHLDLDDLESRHLRRFRRTLAGAQGPLVQLDGRAVLCLGSNNYLGLADDPRLARATIEAVSHEGVGAGASPLVTGHMTGHAALEAEIAGWLECDRALLFGSGWHANVGVIAALTGREDEVFSDELNHASLIDGCRLSRARVTVFPHRDVAALADALAASRARRRLIVLDAVFSMDGDVAPLREIVALADRHDAWLYVDEAHSVGVFGPAGRGLVAELGLADRVTLRMGTLGKAFASYGAFVAGAEPVVEWLLNRARPYVFSTALPPSVVAATRAALAIVAQEESRRVSLWDNARLLHARLRDAGLTVGPLESPIVPLVIGESVQAVGVAARALERGVLAPAIRPPTVPEGTARLRLTPLATHSPAQIEQAAEVLVAAVADSGGMPSGAATRMLAGGARA